jgi:hypothetical protein
MAMEFGVKKERTAGSANRPPKAKRLAQEFQGMARENEERLRVPQGSRAILPRFL